MHFTGILLALILTASAWADTADGETELKNQLHSRLETLVAETEGLPGAAIWIIGPGEQTGSGFAAGVANRGGEAFTPATPIRIASNTKSYLAAAYLRLFEQGEAELDTPISELISETFNSLLTSNGYETDRITPRHLLMHTSGMADHVDDVYVAAIFAEPDRVWTRAEQLEHLVSQTQPHAPPDRAHFYSDTGYVLLGHILERITGEPLARTVRTELGLDALELNSTWWEIVETDIAPRAHQYFSGTDTSHWHGSVDLFGGGGLVANTQDLARFYAALFRGEVFEQAETLDLMTSAPGQLEPQTYRIGLQYKEVSGLEVYFHLGFWGSYAGYVPELDIAFAAVALEADALPDVAELMDEAIAARAAGAD